MSCGPSCARILLIAFNFVFWLSGVAILGVGIWILADPDLQDYINVIHNTDEEYFRYAAYILIAFGTFIFLVGFCGCCGAIRNSKCLLGFYIFFLILVFGGELAAGILAAVYKNEITDKFDEGLVNAIQKDYMKTSGSWDSVQKELKCCGGVGPDDYDNSTWASQSGKLLPVSCCQLDASNQPVNADTCQKKEDNYYKSGCKEKLVDWVNSHSIILIGVGCGIAALQIIGLVFAICLCRSLNQEKYA